MVKKTKRRSPLVTAVLVFFGLALGGLTLTELVGMAFGASPADAQTKPTQTIQPVKKTAAPAPAAAAARAAPAAPDFQVAQQFQKAGVKTCLTVAAGLGAYTMQGVTEYASASTWNSKQPNNRLLVALIGQKYGNSPAAPYGISSVFSAPTSEGKCDGATVQVIPTASACAAVQGQILDKGKMLASLAGVPMLQNEANARVMLLPTAGNGCVIVGFNNTYAD